MAAVLLSVPAALLSQTQSPQRPTFRAGIDLVQIDVVVVDEQGQPVRGLTASDFTLLDRKAPQEIAAFTEVLHEPVAGVGETPLLPPTLVRDVASNTTSRTERTVVVVIDDLHLFRGRTETARHLARRVVNEAGASTSMAVLFTSGEHSTQVTEDHARLLAAVETTEGRKAVRRPHEACDQPAGPRCSLQDFFENMHLFSTLQDAARMLAANDGRRKAFVLISEGLGLGLQGIFATRTTTFGLTELEAAGLDVGVVATEGPSGTGVSHHLLAAVQMMDSLRRANVATYALDPRGHVSQQELMQECYPPPGWLEMRSDRCSEHSTWSSEVRAAQDGLALMADASGGFAVTNSDDLDAGLDRVLAELDHYYLLGFYPGDREGDRFRPVDVQVNRPGVTVRFRRGYMPGGPPPPPENDSPLETLAAGVMAVPDVPMKLSAVPLPAGARDTAVPVAVSVQVAVPRERLQEADGRLRDDLEFAVFAANERNGRVTAGAGEPLRLSLAPLAGAAVPDEVRYQIDTVLTLQPGRYQLRASGISAKLGAGGSVYLTLDVPDYADDAQAVSPIALGHAAGPRVPVLRSTGSGSTAAAPPLPFAPTLDREFASTDTLRVFAQVTGRGRASGMSPRFEVFDVARDRIASEFTPPMDDQGRIDVTMRLAELAPGGYVLRLVVSGAEGAVTRKTGFVVR